MSEPTGPRWFFANLVQVKLSQAASGGVMSMIELVGPSGDMPPLHVHWTDDEAWFVLEGEMSFHVGDEQPIRVSAGELAFGPRGVPHTYRVESATPARWLAVCMTRPARTRLPRSPLSQRSVRSSCSGHQARFPRRSRATALLTCRLVLAIIVL